MRNKLLYILVLALSLDSKGQTEGGLENYYYMKANGQSTMVPVVHYVTSKNWYGEARYNYEDLGSFSLYGGKKFSKDGIWSYSATPIIGGIVGVMNGGSLGLNLEVERGSLFLASQSQYSFSFEDPLNKYFFTWSEMGYKPLKWCYTGFALQQTSMHKESGIWETGYMLGFSFRSWTIPLYVFSPSSQERYFILGVNWDWNSKKRKSKNNPPVLVSAGENTKL